MPAYVIVSYDVVDPEAFEAYVPGVLPILMKYQTEILVADPGARSIEGQSRQVNVVLKFPTEEAMQAFYDDPEYQPLKALRIRTTANCTLVAAKAFTPPA
jgi:uncharacterized protein (DUF1330 family)